MDCVIKENNWFGIKMHFWDFYLDINGYRLSETAYLEHLWTVLLKKTIGLASKVHFSDFYLDI